MIFRVLSLFPELMASYFQSSIMAKAVEKGLIEYQLVNIRDFATDRHHKCDDEVYGGGAGMLMLPGPTGRALDFVGAMEADRHVVYLSPSGKLFDQAKARELATHRDLILICGRYEGLDQRIIDKYVDEELSIGDYVLSSGEVAALTLIDAVYRLIDGVISSDSLTEESFEGGLLEYPQYTRPEVYDSMRVPEVLLSGHHAQIERWRAFARVEKTMRNRPDLIERAKARPDVLAIIESYIKAQGDGSS